MTIKVIPHSGGRYYADDHGGIFRMKNDVFYKMKPRITKNGYHCVCIAVNGKKETHYVHRLIAQTFIKNPLNLSKVIHKNNIKTDNRISNLRWSSHIGVMKYMKARRRSAARLRHPNCRGAVIINDEVYACVSDAAEKLNIKYSTLYTRFYRKMKGYKWISN